MTTGAVIIRSGKGRKSRTAFMGASTRREVLRYLRHEKEDAGPLWVTLDGARLTYAGLRAIVRRRARAAGVSVPSLHSLRRAFALVMLKGGADILSISRLLGHADLSLLQRYIRQMVDDLPEVHRKAGPVDNTL